MKPCVQPQLLSLHGSDLTHLLFQTSQTSALDSETEMKLMTDVNSMLADQKRTSVFIAHR